MNAIELISQDLFDKVRSRYSNLEMGDEDGNVTTDPRQARFFDFDYVVEGNNVGRVSISINERGALKVFYSKGILEDADPLTEQMWFNFLREMRMFAKRRLLRFDTRDITKSNLDKTDFQYLASTGTKEDTMAESRMFGSSKSSYLPLEKTRLIIRHSRPVNDEQRGSRSRYINAIYVENADGERWKCPINSLRLGQAMQRHVANGGRPYDDHGKKIVEIAEQIAQLAAFKKQAHHVVKDSMQQGDASSIMERACARLDELRECMSNLSRQGFYESWKESFQPQSESDQMVMDQATMEDYKSKFTISTFAEDLTQYFPLIHRIMQETGEVDLEDYTAEALKGDQDKLDVDKDGNIEADDLADLRASKKEKTAAESFETFEEWANRLAEGQLAMDTVGELARMLKDGSISTVGTDATPTIEALEGIGIHDEELAKDLEDLAESTNGSGNPTETIMGWLQRVDPTAYQEINSESAEQPADQEPTGLEPGVNTAPAPTQEDTEQAAWTTRDIAEMVKSFYDRKTGKFPIGETGVVTKVTKEFGDRAGLLAEKLVQHLSSVKDEGFIARGLGGEIGGSIGDVAGTALGTAVGGPVGGLIGGTLGDIAGTSIGAELGDDDEEDNKNEAYNPDPFGRSDRAFRRREHEAEFEKEKELSSGIWYIRINGKILRDRATKQPAAFNGKQHANNAAMKMMQKDFNKGKTFTLTTSPTDKISDESIGQDHADKSWLKKKPEGSSDSILKGLKHFVKDIATGKNSEQDALRKGELKSLESMEESEMSDILKLSGIKR